MTILNQSRLSGIILVGVFIYFCHGGCLHDGFLNSGDFRSKPFLCSAYKKIFAQIEKRLQEANI